MSWTQENLGMLMNSHTKLKEKIQLLESLPRSPFPFPAFLCGPYDFCYEQQQRWIRHRNNLLSQ